MPVMGGHHLHKFYAQLAKASYASEGDEAIKRLLQKSHAGWHVLDKFSDLFPWVTVIVKPSEHRGVVVFRGSKNNTTDRELDFDIMRGSEIASARFHKVAALVGALRRASPHTHWTVVGHSSGGTLAMLLNRRFGIESHAFNPGATFNSVKIIGKLPRANGHSAGVSYIHIVPQDELSRPVLALVADNRGKHRNGLDRVVYYKQKPHVATPHDVSNFV